jgi:predicted  nucleic acid-binding Zn-ribbon protein
VTHPLLDLQAADTLADQLRHRRAHLPERERVAEAQQALDDLGRRRAGLQQRLDELETEIERAERESHEIDAQKAKFGQQLRTVIAPREAEALQHEIAVLDERRSGLDDRELEALEEQSHVDDDLQAVAGEEPALRAALDAAEAEAQSAETAIDAELADIAGRLDALRAGVDPGLLTRYDRLRGQQMVAAAELQGHRCSGCHLDLSPGELDEVRDVARGTGGIADCPQCNRLLVVG